MPHGSHQVHYAPPPDIPHRSGRLSALDTYTRPFRGLAYLAITAYAAVSLWHADIATRIRQFTESVQYRALSQPLYYQYDAQNTDHGEPTCKPGVRNDPIIGAGLKGLGAVGTIAKMFLSEDIIKQDHAGVDNVPNTRGNRNLYAIVRGEVPEGGVFKTSVGGNTLVYVGSLDTDLCYAGGIIPKGGQVRGTKVIPYEDGYEKRMKGSRAHEAIMYEAGCFEAGTQVAVFNLHLANNASAQIFVRPGDTVLPQIFGGTPLAVIGETGEARGVHAHTEIHVVPDGVEVKGGNALQTSDTNITFIAEAIDGFLQPSYLERTTMRERTTCDATARATLDKKVAKEGERYVFTVEPLYGSCPWATQQQVTLAVEGLPSDLGDALAKYLADGNTKKPFGKYLFSMNASPTADAQGQYVVNDIGYVASDEKINGTGGHAHSKKKKKGGVGKSVRRAAGNLLERILR